MTRIILSLKQTKDKQLYSMMCSAAQHNGKTPQEYAREALYSSMRYTPKSEIPDIEQRYDKQFLISVEPAFYDRWMRKLIKTRLTGSENKMLAVYYSMVRKALVHA